MRKLPLWGDETYETNFEWPTEEDWALMDPNVSITSFEFGSSSKTNISIGSVRVNYSDGDSAIFENMIRGKGRAHKTFRQQKIDFDASDPIYAISAVSGS